MKKTKTILIVLSIISIVGCQQNPTASFTANKSEYIAGDTVHLTNTSANGHSYLWTMPDGTTLTTTNADYLIPANQGFATLTFALEAFSKNGKKNNSVSQSIAVIPASVFSIDGSYSYNPINVAGSPYGKNWQITAYVQNYPQEDINPAHAAAYLMIKLPGTAAPTSAGTYSLQANDTLALGKAYIWITRVWWELQRADYVSSSGQLQITIENGKVHAVFNNIQTNYPPYTISGNIYCP
ncbi:MAG: hypothetical protein HY840_03195 [Bacteroidetes bacterium]|nr:hypothetical protein [Bacteroidota bacterium]